MNKYLSAETRYNNDPKFHVIVDILECAMNSLNCPPSELRDAVIYACTRFEMKRVSPPSIFIHKNELIAKKVFDEKIKNLPIKKHHHIRTTDPRWSGNKYLCVCGYETKDVNEFTLHINNN